MKMEISCRRSERHQNSRTPSLRLNEVLTHGVRQKYTTVPTVPTAAIVPNASGHAANANQSAEASHVSVVPTIPPSVRAHAVLATGARKGPKTEEQWRERRNLWLMMCCLVLLLTSVTTATLLFFLLPESAASSRDRR